MPAEFWAACTVCQLDREGTQRITYHGCSCVCVCVCSKLEGVLFEVSQSVAYQLRQKQVKPELGAGH